MSTLHGFLEAHDCVSKVKRLDMSDVEQDGLYNFRFASQHHLRAQLDHVELYSLTYRSSAMPIHGFVVIPIERCEPLPLVLFNRGGNNRAENLDCPFPPHRLGRITAADALFALGRIASWGYAVAASQYRGCYDLSQGDEFGEEVAEIENLRLVLKDSDAVDLRRTGIVAYSRGALPAFLLAAEHDWVKAVVAVGALTAVPHQKEGKSLSPQARVSDLSTQLKVLLLHGEHDDRCPPAESVEMNRLLQSRGIESELKIFPEGTHYLDAHDRDAAVLIRAWLDRYV